MFVHDGAELMPISHVYHEAHALFVLFPNQKKNILCRLGA
jgi:hypothetical protein